VKPERDAVDRDHAVRGWLYTSAEEHGHIAPLKVR